jgi:hypothetical protein
MEPQTEKSWAEQSMDEEEEFTEQNIKDFKFLKSISTSDDFVNPSQDNEQDNEQDKEQDKEHGKKQNEQDNEHNEHNEHNDKSDNDHDCEYGVSCNNYYCELIHPPGRRYKCKYGNGCNKIGCKFLHPNKKTNECKFGINCNNDLCKFQHPGKKVILTQNKNLIETIKTKINQYWNDHPESKPLDIKIIERTDADEGIDCRYCYDAYKHTTQADCPCRWTLKINKNGEFQEISCQECKSLEWIKVNSTYQNCLVDAYGCPYSVKLDTNGFPCKCIHPYAMCPYYGLLFPIKKYSST